MACILLLISFIDSTYSQTLSLLSLKKDEKEVGLEFAYNQTEFENWSRGVDGTEHNMHLAIPIQLSNVSKLSILPCLTYSPEKYGTLEKDLNAGCYLRYTAIYIYDTKVLGSFYRLGAGVNTNDSEGSGDGSAVVPTLGNSSDSNNSDDAKSAVWKAHSGGGLFLGLR